ncbi:AAA family ATPase [Helcobacillus massiliensis]|uniref:Nuclease SbcCD subunit C n=1 Tax=Helcobacillus massiliensis TaxID=521392 RepID=A0A839R0M0_9MICO|nr:SMC family ATPase [Helcobacillus massiliensis]MBB3023317.1 exonuclease SbcC [Helcobacillus massiliensis]
MRLHHMTFTGIGPFRGEHRIDFTALGASGLFLLEGPTGSGKSSIIDAVVFGLYGQVAGEASSQERLRSHFAGADEPSAVDLFFETTSGLFRITRTPRYLRPKRRGDGLTQQNATAKLFRYTSEDALRAAIAGEESAGAVQPVSVRIDEVGAEINRIVGLTHEQFTQTVVLPQGEFARFLRAKSEDRKDVLEKVFGTRLFTTIEKQFIELRREARAAAEASQQALAQALERFLEASSADADTRAEAHQELTAPGGLTTVLTDAAAATAAARTAHEDAAARTEKARTGVTTAEKATEAATRHLQAVQGRQEADGIAAHLERTREASDLAARQLAAHERAERPFYALQARARAERDADATRLALPKDDQETPQQWPDLIAHHDTTASTAAAAAAELASAAQLETGLPKRLTDLEEQRDAVTTTEARLTEQKAALQQRPTQRDDLADRVKEAAEQSRDLAGAQATLETSQERQESARLAAATAEKIQQLAGPIRDAHTAAAQAVETERALRQQRIDSMAAELATSLTDGDPCPVCGAAEHPSPATSDQPFVTDEQIEEAEGARSVAEKRLSDLNEKKAALESTRAAAHTAAGERSVETAAAEVAAAEQKLADVRTAEQRHADLENSLAAFDEETQRLTTAAHQAETALSAARTRVEETAHAIQRDQAAVAEARADADTVAERRTRLSNRAKTAAEAGKRLRAAQDARQRWLTAAETVTDEMQTAGFTSEEDVTAARISEETRAQHRQVQTQRATAQAKLTDLLADEAVAALTLAETSLEDAECAVTAAREQQAAARAALEEKQRQLSLAERAATATAAALTSLEQAAQKHRDTSATAEEKRALAEVITGGSGSSARLPLSTYVVIKRFEAVVDAANARLSVLSGTDLELELGEPAAGGTKKIGLDLEVVDRRTDQRRSPASLSGGETFFVSLALALGLADIVTAESGGVQMNTLFIDEGFGSLDPEKLDSVIAEIRALGNAGRTVGIVSHVAELKQQIPEKIHVRRRSDGTSTLDITV